MTIHLLMYSLLFIAIVMIYSHNIRLNKVIKDCRNVKSRKYKQLNLEVARLNRLNKSLTEILK